MDVTKLHDEVCKALDNAGAVTVASLLPDYQGSNVDAVFPVERVLIEVKSLCEDQTAAADLSEKLGTIVAKWRHLPDMPIIFGTVKVAPKAFPPAVRDDIVRYLGRRVSKDIKQANSQLKATQRALGGDWIRYVLFVAPTHSGIHPGVIGSAAFLHLRGGNCSSIDGIFCITVPVDDVPTGDRPPTISTHSRGGHTSLPDELKERIAHAWTGHLTTDHGWDIAPLLSASEADFMRLFMEPES
jgi:hypothetical protein